MKGVQWIPAAVPPHRFSNCTAYEAVEGLPDGLYMCSDFIKAAFVSYASSNP